MSVSSTLPKPRGWRFWLRTFWWGFTHPLSSTNDNPGVQATLADYAQEVRRLTLEEVRDELEMGYHGQAPAAMHPADYVTKRFELDGHEGLVIRVDLSHTKPCNSCIAHGPPFVRPCEACGAFDPSGVTKRRSNDR